MGMEARVREIQIHVTKIDGEVQQIRCMEQRFAAASNHWTETVRKLAERIDSIGAQSLASHLGVDKNQEINTRLADLENGMAEFIAHMLSPWRNELGIGDMEARSGQAHVTIGSVQRLGRM